MACPANRKQRKRPQPKRKHKVMWDCPCGEIGKNNSLTHTRIVATISTSHSRFHVCENHLDNYKRCNLNNHYKIRKLRAVPRA